MGGREMQRRREREGEESWGCGKGRRGRYEEGGRKIRNRKDGERKREGRSEYLLVRECGVSKQKLPKESFFSAAGYFARGQLLFARAELIQAVSNESAADRAVRSTGVLPLMPLTFSSILSQCSILLFNSHIGVHDSVQACVTACIWRFNSHTGSSSSCIQLPSGITFFSQQIKDHCS